MIAKIIPWNFPLLMATRKIAPALAAGARRGRFCPSEIIGESEFVLPIYNHRLAD
jgi:aldehyde dehydrogenase family protein